MSRNKLVSSIMITFTLSAYAVHAIAQMGVNEVMFQNNKVTLNDKGDKDTARVIDPVNGDVVLKILPILYPVKVNGSATEAEKAPYPVSAIMRKKLAAGIINGGSLKSIFNGKPLPDGIITLGLTNIVMTPDGSVAYYNLYKTDYYMEKENVIRKIDLQKDIVKVFEENRKFFKQKFKEPYLVLNGSMTTMTFHVHNGTIER